MTTTNLSHIIMQPEAAVSFMYMPQKQLATKLNLSNPSHHKVAFRVKTNAFDHYLVKPQSGFLLPNTSIDISITKKPNDHEPSTPVSDKFLVTTIPIDDHHDLAILNDSKKLLSIWDTTPKSKIQSQKLAVELDFKSMLTQANSLQEIALSEVNESPQHLMTKTVGNLCEDSTSETESSTPIKQLVIPHMSDSVSSTESIKCLKVNEVLMEELASPVMKKLDLEEAETLKKMEEMRMEEIRRFQEGMERISNLENRMDVMAGEIAAMKEKVEMAQSEVEEYIELKKELKKEKRVLKKEIVQAKKDIDSKRVEKQIWELMIVVFVALFIGSVLV